MKMNFNPNVKATFIPGLGIYLKRVNTSFVLPKVYVTLGCLATENPIVKDRFLARLNMHAFCAVTETFKRQHLRETVKDRDRFRFLFRHISC